MRAYKVLKEMREEAIVCINYQNLGPWTYFHKPIPTKAKSSCFAHFAPQFSQIGSHVPILVGYNDYIDMIWYDLIWWLYNYMHMNINMNVESRYIKITFVVHLEIPARRSQEAPSHPGSHGFASPNALVFERWSWCLVIFGYPWCGTGLDPMEPP